MMKSIHLAAALAFAIAVPFGAAAADLAEPTGDVILTVSGDIGVTNRGDTAVLDLAMLEQLGSETIETTTIWTEGKQVFTGVPLVTLLDVLGVDEGTLHATAINDYTIEIPVEDVVPGGPMMAYLANGEPMSVRDKGPLWIVYPYDSNPEYQSETAYSRSIWQLDRISVQK